MTKMVSPKTLTDISQEWDFLGNRRQTIIEQERDISLKYVTVPNIIKRLQKVSAGCVLDAGCGTGYLTDKIAAIGLECYGVDISKESIEIAKKNYKRENLHFINCSIKNYSCDFKFDICVSNMVFMDDPEWKESIENIYNLLRHGGTMIAIITHPWFWPKYWNYQDADWFQYDKEIFIESDFSITTEKKLGISTHIHRPLSSYFSAIISSGFSIVGLEEVKPIGEIPDNYKYAYPRFLMFICEKI